MHNNCIVVTTIVFYLTFMVYMVDPIISFTSWASDNFSAKQDTACWLSSDDEFSGSYADGLLRMRSSWGSQRSDGTAWMIGRGASGDLGRCFVELCSWARICCCGQRIDSAAFHLLHGHYNHNIHDRVTHAVLLCNACVPRVMLLLSLFWLKCQCDLTSACGIPWKWKESNALLQHTPLIS